MEKKDVESIIALFKGSSQDERQNLLVVLGQLNESLQAKSYSSFTERMGL